MLGQPIDEQAQHHDQAEGHDALGLLQEDRGGQEERVFEEGKAALDAVLVLVDSNELLVGEPCGVEDIGRHNEAGRPRDRLRQLRLIQLAARRDEDVVAGRSGARMWTPAPRIARLDAQLGWLQLEPSGQRLGLLRQSGARIGFTGKRPITQMPQLLAPLLLRLGGLSFEGGSRLPLAGLGAHHHPALPSLLRLWSWPLRQRQLLAPPLRLPVR